MSVSEVSGLMKYKDEDGNVYLMFPVTTKDNVDGIDEIESELAALKNKVDNTPQADYNQNDDTKPDYIKNRPFYEEQSVGYLLEETTLEVADSTAYLMNPLSGNLAIGENYTVMYNGTEYECTAENVNMDGIDFVALGNTTMFGGTSGTDIPFGVVILTKEMAESMGFYGMVMILDDSVSITLSISGVFVNICTISDKYLPPSKNSNILNGSQAGSLRTITSSGENDEYTIGYAAFAEGNYTIASGSSSHAEGNATIASSPSSHAEGNATIASGYSSHAEGNTTTASGAYSHTEGSNTTASGGSSHSEGYLTKASGEGSHAEGSNTIASGNYSHAEGRYSTASGNYSHAEGNGSSSDFETVTSNDFSSLTEDIEIKSSTAYGDSSHAEGYQTLAYRDESHAEGYRTKAFGYSSHAEGNRTIASGSSSHAEGSNTIASGNYSHAEGRYSTASGNYSHAEGNDTTASGVYSHAEGNDTTASGEGSHTEGRLTVASGTYSHAEGWRTTASGECSHAEGYFTIAFGDYQHVQGKCNIGDSDNKYAHIVGNGNIGSNSSIDRSNAHTIDWDGNGWFAGKIKMGGTSQDDENSVEVATMNDVSKDWNQNDPTKVDYIKNRPFYKEIVEILPETQLTLGDNGYMFTEEIPVVVGSTYNIYWNGTKYSCVCKKTIMDGMEVHTLGNFSIWGEESTGEPFTIIVLTSPEIIESMVGITAMAQPLDDSTSLTISITSDVYHEVPIEYLSDEIPCEIDTAKHLISFNADMSDEIQIQNGLLKLKVGNTYEVLWNGVKYECVAKEYPFKGHIYIGDLTKYTDSNAVANEPFYIYDNLINGNSYAKSFDETSYNFVSVISISPTVRQLDKKYLNILPGEMLETISLDTYMDGETVATFGKTSGFITKGYEIKKQLQTGMVKVSFSYNHPNKNGIVTKTTELILSACSETRAFGTFASVSNISYIVGVILYVVSDTSVTLELIPLYTNSSENLIMGEIGLPIIRGIGGDYYSLTVGDTGELATYKLDNL